MEHTPMTAQTPEVAVSPRTVVMTNVLVRVVSNAKLGEALQIEGQSGLLDQVRSTWEGLETSSLSFTELMVLSQFDRREIDALGLDAQAVLGAYQAFAQENEVRLQGASAREIAHAFQMEYVDNYLIQTADVLRGHETRVQTNDVLTAAFGDTGALGRIKEDLGTENSAVYLKLEQKCKSNAVDHVVKYGIVSFAFREVKSSTEFAGKAISKLKAILKKIEEELARLFLKMDKETRTIFDEMNLKYLQSRKFYLQTTINALKS
jgi:hypothetical protein